MAVVLGRLVMFPTDEVQERARGPFAKFYLDEIDDYIERVLEVATTLDKRLAKDLRTLGVEPDPDDFDHELVNNDTCELAHCRNLMAEVHDMLTMIKEIALARQARTESGLN